MLADDLSLGCERCAVHVDRGRPESAYARVFDKLEPDSITPDWPQQLELALSNSCNLQCIMCNGELSSAIRIHREGRPPLPEVYGDDFFADLDSFLPHLSSIVFLGGEPFLAKESMRVMDRLVELGLTPACSFTTNGTQWNDRVERMVTSVPTYVAISLDGMDSGTFSSIRIGADHQTVMSNVQRFAAATAQSGGRVSLAFCLMRNNWREFPELLLWAEDRGLAVFVNSVEHPPSLSPAHASGTELREMLDTFQELDATLQSRLSSNLEVWDREVANIERLLTHREVSVDLPSTPVDTSDFVDHSRSADPVGTRARATVSVGSDQLVHRIDDDSTEVIGLDLGDMVGRSIWDLQPFLTTRLGRTASSGLARFDDGREEVRISFVETAAAGAISMHAMLTPGTDGDHTWDLRFTLDDRAEDGGVRSSPAGRRRSMD